MVVAVRYSDDVLAPGWQHADKPKTVDVTVSVGMVVEEPASGFCGWFAASSSRSLICVLGASGMSRRQAKGSTGAPGAFC